MKTSIVSQRRADLRRPLQIGFLASLTLLLLALAAPRPAAAGIVVRAAIGNVDVVYRDGARPRRVLTSTCPTGSPRLEVRPVARRVVTTRPLTQGCDDCRTAVHRAGCDGRGGLVWVPGHWEKQRVRERGHGHGHGHARVALKKVWIPGHWCRR
jgi:hypothetical protein